MAGFTNFEVISFKPYYDDVCLNCLIEKSDGRVYFFTYEIYRICLRIVKEIMLK